MLNHHKIKPIILLETLSQSKIKSILWFTYITIIFGGIIGIFEYGWSSNSIYLPGNYCYNNKITNISCTYIMNQTNSNSDTRWNGLLTLDKLELYFAIVLNVKRPLNEIITYKHIVPTIITLYGDNEQIFHHQTNITFICNNNQCNFITSLLDEHQYMYNRKHTYNQYDVHILYKNFDVLKFGIPSYKIIHHNANYRIAQIVLRMIFLIIGIIILCYWIHRAHIKQNHPLHQQYWITISLIAALFLIDPFYPALMYYQVEILWILSGIFYWMGSTILLVFWLSIIHGMVNKPRNLWTFYYPKLIFGVLLLLSVCISTIILPTLAESATVIRIVSIIIFTLSFVYWLIMMIRYIRSTNVKLKLLPYITSRFSQLSFRFYVMQTILVIIYAIIHYGLYFIIVPSYVGSYWGSISSLFVITIYLWIMAYIYLPANDIETVELGDSLNVVTPKNKILDHPISSVYGSFNKSILDAKNSTNFIYQGSGTDFEFNLQTALWLCYMANQAYFDFPSYPRTKSSCGQTSYIGRFGFELIEVISNEIEDIHAYIAQRDHIVVISFRGTASRQNARDDLRFTRVQTNEEVFPGLKRTVMIHNGFLKAYQAIAIDVDIAMADIERNHVGHPQPLRIYVTGHSLGGALAKLAAFSFATRLQLHPQVYSFGSPRVGDHAFAEVYNEAVPYTYRICYNRDIFTTIPKFCFMYKHVGVEVYVDKFGNWIISPSFVEKILNPRRTNLQDHIMYAYLQGLKKSCLLEEDMSRYVIELNNNINDNSYNNNDIRAPLLTPGGTSSQCLQDFVIHLPIPSAKVVITSDMDEYFK